MTDTISVKKSDVLKAYEHARGDDDNGIMELLLTIFPQAFDDKEEKKECEHEWVWGIHSSTRRCNRCEKIEQLYTGDEIVDWAEGHYWDSVAHSKDYIMIHIKRKFGGEK